MPIISNKIEVSNWLFLNITADKDTLQMEDIATINCDLSYLSNKSFEAPLPKKEIEILDLLRKEKKCI